MQDYGQPGGEPPAPPKKKGGKGLLIVGVILLIIGIILAIVGAMPMMSAKKAADVEDWGKDLKSGDSVLVTGEITEKADYPLGDGKMYVLDDKVPIISSDDIGNKGDTIYVNCEYTAVGNLTMLEAKSVPMTMPLIIVGIILLIVGIILMIVGIKKKKA